MKILAADTAEKSCSVAVMNGRNLLAEIMIINQETHSRHLMSMMDTCLKMSRLDISDMDAFAVAKGPGSFTGLRIGISIVKGLAAASEKPVVTVSNLDALAQQAVLSDLPICVMMDARKSEVYVCRYRLSDGQLYPEGEPLALSPENAISGIDTPYLFMGSGALLYREKIRQALGELAVFAPDDAHILRASTIARSGYERLLKGESDDLASFVPLYIRKADAKMPSAL